MTGSMAMCWRCPNNPASEDHTLEMTEITLDEDSQTVCEKCRQVFALHVAYQTTHYPLELLLEVVSKAEEDPDGLQLSLNQLEK